ncbi:stabilin-2 isoform X2 [Strongylocentrotus purpuratus]|uniref:Uncharacterized protein n=1 Tax=Strongylocentrotus purpuratus TaxID=7668 RepID=A0A7M7PX41_STRPU|nr:stabilin-2 isoform X2 [Strongylocentrotus purpuratus]
MDRSGVIRLFIDYLMIIVLLFPVNPQASFSSGSSLSHRQVKVDANHAVVSRDTRSPTSGSISTAPSLNICAKLTDGAESNTFNSSCTMCAVSEHGEDFKENACPLHSRPVSDAIRGCTFQSALSVFSFDGCNFECANTDLTLREWCLSSQFQEEFQEGCFCDECRENTTLRSCPNGAECATMSPGQVLCQCSSGYVGNGLVCYGNIIERLEHLNGEDEDLEGRLTDSLQLLEASFKHLWLQDRDVFYTVFMPVDEAFNLAHSDFGRQLEASVMAGSDERAEVFLQTLAKVHIVPGYVDTYLLKRNRDVYTLAGPKIVVSQDSPNITISIEGSGEMVRVIHGDLPASNGVIHIIDRVLLSPSDLNTMVQESQGSILEVLSSYSNLWTFAGMIMSSEVLRSDLDSQAVSRTIFAVTDDALLQMDPDLTSLLLSTGQWEEYVRYFIYQHMAPIQLSTHDLMKAGVIQNYHREDFEIRVSENGRITVAGFANITSPDIAASNGVIHIVDAMLISSSFFSLPETCFRNQTEEQIQCICDFGYEGHGYLCEPINACLRPHDCDTEAQCEPTGPDTYQCVCPPGWALDKNNCYSNLAVELSSLSDAQLFWQLIQAVSLDGYLSHIDDSLGVIVPSPHMLQLINSTTGGSLAERRIMAYFVRSHMFMMDPSQRSFNETLPSLQPGENVIIDGPYSNLSNINGGIAQVENATNGLIFVPISYAKDYWINRLLEVQGKIDFLTPISGDVQDYSQAWQLIQVSGLLPFDDTTPYTIFLPDNVAMSSLNWSTEIPNDFLQHHLVIGKTLYYHNISEELNITSASGQHLHFLASSEAASVDMIPIAAPDILILPNGIAHGIPGILSSSLREGTCEDGMNGGCHQGARCMQKTSTLLQCQCLDGYHGDGIECVASDPCSHDNGGCHFRAACIPLGLDERRCSCNYGYDGDGFFCLGSIFEELRSLPEASLFVYFLESLDSRSFLRRSEGSFTLFVPSNAAITVFLQNQSRHEELYPMTQYILYHVIAGSHMTMTDLRNRTTLGMMNGQDLGIGISQNDKLILGASGRFISADHNASNGIIYIIDTMLTPPRIYEWPREQDMGTSSDEDNRRRHPNFGRDMGILGTSHNISIFLQLLQRTPMFEEFFIDPHPHPGHGGPPPRTPPRRPPPRRPPPRINGSRVSSREDGRGGGRGWDGPGSGSEGELGGGRGWDGPDSDREGGPGNGWEDGLGSGREGGHGQSGYREGPGRPGGMSGEGSSGVEESIRGWERSGGMHQGKSYGRSRHRREGRMQRGSTLRLDDLKSTQRRSALSRDFHIKHAEAANPNFIGDRYRRNRVSYNHGHYQKRSLDRPLDRPFDQPLDRPLGGRPPGRHPPHGMRQGGRFESYSTIFAPTDEAFMRLPPDKLDELMDPSNRLLLQEFIAHHVLPDERLFDDLWPKTGPYTVPSLQGSDLRLSIIDQGKLFVNERSRVIGVGLEFEGGVLFPVSEVVSLPRMDGRCDIVETHIRKSRCKRCGSHMCPLKAEQVGAEQSGCRFHGGWYERGCQTDCQFTEVTRECCQGYYGPSCQECPGGPTYPCNNHGRCNEGYDNDGVCSCREGFAGTACERCLPGFYGPSCRKCRCSNSSICNGQSGECFCSVDRDGPLCERVLTFIPTCDPPCHQNAVCRYGNRCQCSPQYHGDGYTCNTINKCFSENGGCSVHASCTHNTSAINVNCTCHDGYHGDGIVCLPVNICEENNGGCHPNASCRFRGPNIRSCVCRPPYWGDGLECHPPLTSCLTNNGGCSYNAHCQEGEDGGPVECTCFSRYVGDGIVCNGNLYDTLASQPEFRYFFEMMMQLANESHEGERLVRDLLKLNDQLTIFIPLNPKLSELTFYPSQVLLHVVHDRWSKEDLLEGDDEELETWSGHELNVDVTYDKHHQAIVTIEDVPIVKFGMEATNGVIHMIDAPLPIWMVLDYDKEDDNDDDNDDEKNRPRMRPGWSSSSRIFAAVAVPLGLLAFIIVVVLYWFRGRKIRELSRHDQGQAVVSTTSGIVQGTDLPPATTPSPPISPVPSVDQGDIQYSEFDQLMSEETGEKREPHRETSC